MARSLARVFAAALLCLASSARADILPDGIDTSKQVHAPAPSRPADQCSVLWYDPTQSFGFEVPRMISLGLNVTTASDPSQINPANLAGYAVLVLAYTPGNAPALSQAVIQSYLQSGHGLFIHQPNALGPLLYAPTGFEVTINSEYWCDFPTYAAAHIVNAGHPITGGITDLALSGAFDEVGPLGAGWTVLTRSVDCGDPALAVGNLGSGRIVFDDGNASYASMVPGADTYWAGIFNWLCSSGVVPTRHSTWGTLKAAYR